SSVHSTVEMITTGPAIRFRFAHDRIQQAVISTIETDARTRLHYTVGRRLLQHAGAEKQEQLLFDIVGQLNQGRSAICDLAELDELARLNLKAAHKELKAGAAQQALGYSEAGISLLGGDWEHRYDLMLDLHITGAEAAFLA